MTTSGEAPSNTAAGVDKQDWTDAFAAKTKEAFLAAYAEDVVLERTLGPAAVHGVDEAFAGMARVFGNYDSVPKFIHQAVNGNRTYLEWEVTAFGDPEPIRGVTVLTRNDAGKIAHISINHRPLFKVLRLAHESLPALTERQREMFLVEETLTERQRKILVTRDGSESERDFFMKNERRLDTEDPRP